MLQGIELAQQNIHVISTFTLQIWSFMFVHTADVCTILFALIEHRLSHPTNDTDTQSLHCPRPEFHTDKPTIATMVQKFNRSEEQILRHVFTRGVVNLKYA
jgi:hypothetical protein